MSSSFDSSGSTEPCLPWDASVSTDECCDSSSDIGPKSSISRNLLLALPEPLPLPLLVTLLPLAALPSLCRFFDFLERLEEEDVDLSWSSLERSRRLSFFPLLCFFLLYDSE
uniref:Uncharacterized protein n=1 Tax=Anopheles christyi TaxID=43041 RepID=A0A182KI44_9DIPT